MHSADLMILDVRTDRDWVPSQWKIEGAGRVDPSKTDRWMTKYPKDQTIVLYCT